MRSPSIALIKQALKEKGMRQQELAERVGFSKDHLSRVLVGKVAFPKSRDTLKAIADALDLDPLQFPEYRHRIQVLPESTRRLIAHLQARGISQAEFIRRVPDYSPGHLQLILRGGTPFPRDAAAIERLAEAAEASPAMFPEYLPLARWRGRVAQAAELALDAADRGVFLHLWGKIEKHLAAANASETTFEDRLFAHFLAHAFGPPPEADAELDTALAYMPPAAQFQPGVQRLLAALHARGWGAAELAATAAADPAEVRAVLHGQMKLREGPLKRALEGALGLTTPESER